jgi:hypothetical protein
MKGLLGKGSLVVLRDGLVGTVAEVDENRNRILVDFGELGCGWVRSSEINERASWILRTSYALRGLQDFLSAEEVKKKEEKEVKEVEEVKADSKVEEEMGGEREEDVKREAQRGPGREPAPPEEKIILPTPPRAPLIEKLPPRIPSLPEELKEEVPRKIDITKLDQVSSQVARLLEEISEMAQKRAILEEQAAELNEKIKPIRDASKAIYRELFGKVEELLKVVESNMRGSQELKSYLGLWREKVLYIIRWLSRIKEEPSDIEKLELLWNLLQKELTPRKVKEIRQKFDIAINRMTKVSSELDTYVAVLPLASIREGMQDMQSLTRLAQAGIWERIKDFGRKLWEFLKSAVRSLLGIRDLISSITGSVRGFVDALVDIGF